MIEYFAASETGRAAALSAATPSMSRSRRGRPRAGEREQRRQAVLDAATAEMIEGNFEQVTMLGIAKRAGASKETLYSWFENKEGLLTELIGRETHDAAEQIRAVVEERTTPPEELVELARQLLVRATAPRSVALRRAAATSLTLGRVTLDLDREKIEPLLNRYFQALPHRGPFLIVDAAVTARLFRGLVLQDVEMRTVMGDERPASEIEARAATAVTRFLSLVTEPDSH